MIFLEPTRLYRLFKEEVTDNGEALALDTCFTLREGTDVTLVSWGAMVYETLQVADEFAEQGIAAEVIDVATLKPIDFDTILASVAKTGRCVIVTEAPRHCSVASEISANPRRTRFAHAARAGAARHRARRRRAAVAARTPLPARQAANCGRGAQGHRIRIELVIK